MREKILSQKRKKRVMMEWQVILMSWMTLESCRTASELLFVL
uniref:Uncharacterized protein n=1 Tax=Arundo donax TaxID=35708 RepID=A0A0A9CEC0_ARUDO